MPEPELTLDEAYERYAAGKIMRRDLLRRMIDELKRIDASIGELRSFLVLPPAPMLPLPPVAMPLGVVTHGGESGGMVTWSEVNDPTRWAASGEDEGQVNGAHVVPGKGRKPRRKTRE